MITWKPHENSPNGTYWQCYKDGVFIGAVYGRLGFRVDRHIVPSDNSPIVFEYGKYDSLRDAAKEFYK